MSYGLSPEARKAGRDAWVEQWAIEEAGPDADKGTLLYYENIAAKLWEQIKAGDKGRARELMNQMARISTLNEYGNIDQLASKLKLLLTDSQKRQELGSSQ